MTISFLHVRPWLMPTPVGMTSSAVYWVFRRGACREGSSLIQKRRNSFGLDPGFNFKSSTLRQIPVSILEALKWDPWSMFEISASFSTISWPCECILARSSRYASSISVDFVSFVQVCHESSASDWFQRLFFLEWIIATSFSPDCQHLLWLHCSVSSMLRWGLLPIYILVIMWREHYAIYIGFRSKLELHTNCKPWCMRLFMVLRRSTSETCWPRWLSCLVARTFVLLHLVYIRRATHTNEIWDQIVFSCRTDSMEYSATRAACNRSLCVFPETLKTFLFIQVYGLWPWFTLTKIKMIDLIVKFDIDLIVRRRWPCM